VCLGVSFLLSMNSYYLSKKKLRLAIRVLLEEGFVLKFYPILCTYINHLMHVFLKERKAFYTIAI